MDPITLGLLIASLYALSRDKPIPILEKLLGGGPQGNGIKTRQILRNQPVLTRQEIDSVCYMQRDVRYFNKDLCGDLFEALMMCGLEPIEVPGRPPGNFLIVPYRHGIDNAAIAVLEAAKRGLHACINVAAILDNSADKILTLTTEAGIAHDRSQIAVLGPIPSAPSLTQGAPRAKPLSASAPTHTIEDEYREANTAGIPIARLMQLLKDDHASPASLDEVALLTSRDYQLITSAIRRRATDLRARAKIEALTDERITVTEKKGDYDNHLANPANGIIVKPADEETPIEESDTAK